MFVKTIETHVFLDDFEVEAGIHVENIEAAFLDSEALSGDSKMMDSVFRSAHSLKGTAGFFSLKKIVAVSHELESVFSQVLTGKLVLNDEIVDVVLQSVDCLRALIEIAPNDSGVETDFVIESLKKHSGDTAPKELAHDFHMPFTFKDKDLVDLIKNKMQHGHKIYYVRFDYNRNFGKFYTHPELLFEGIVSIGSIVEALINGAGVADKPIKSIRDYAAANKMDEIVKAITDYDDISVELLVTSVLELELFSIATELDYKSIHLLGKGDIFPSESTVIKPKEQSAEAADSVDPVKPRGNESSFSMRLDISVINGLLDLANEMILTRNHLLSATAMHTKNIAGLAPILHDMNRLTGEIQEKVMFTRMQPISVIFDRFPRIIRDTAKILGKDITVSILNEDVTLDRYLLESLTDPITQLVKNSADHGLEHAEKRIAAGKSKKGTITLNARMHDGSAFIEVMDDGVGIDVDALKNKAIENGVLSEEKAATATKNEIYSLIFEPGMSTAKKISSLSGRGVGMDIVKNNVEKLGGAIEIESEPGEGTTVRLKVPLTLSVIRALIVLIDNIPYAVPDLNVERIVRIYGDTPGKRLERVSKSIVLSLDGQIIPVVTMDEIESAINGTKPVSVKKALNQYQRDGITKCLVLRGGGKIFALLIDDALDTEQILVKSLPIYFRNCPCYSSATVLGSGRAVMILDAEGIMRFMDIGDIEADNKGIATLSEDEKVTHRQVVIFRCSGKEYYAVEISDVSRIERIDSGDIQVIGKIEYVNIGEETIRLIRPEDYSPAKKQRCTTEKLSVITLKNSTAPMGFLATEVIDKVDDDFLLTSEQIRSDYITGTSAYNEKVLIFLDSDAIAIKIENEKVNKKSVKKGEEKV